MPAGNLKNTLYQLALPILGLRSPIASVQGGSDDENARLCRLLRSQHAVGACIQRFEKGRLTECFTAGNARMEPRPSSVPLPSPRWSRHCWSFACKRWTN